jgi:magnesium transporter
MRVFHVAADAFSELPTLPALLPASGFLWLGCAREELEAQLPTMQGLLLRGQGGALVDLHVSDLLNNQLRSQFDSTSWYDLLVIRRLLSRGVAEMDGVPAVDTSPVGFAVFDRVLLSVHPSDCLVREHFAQRLMAHAVAAPDVRGGSRVPASPAELMLRMVNVIVDSYLELRRELSRHSSQLQAQLMDTRSPFQRWPVLLEARNTLQQLEDTCEDQRSAVQEWLDALDEWPDEADAGARRERELLRVRSRDVLEHIERVLTHVRRLEQAAETAVQIHFSALSHRTNEIMRALTVLTAIFLPLNLITGFFGMNFDALPLIHSSTGIWVAITIMAGVAIGLGGFFWRKRYLGSRPLPSKA